MCLLTSTARSVLARHFRIPADTFQLFCPGRVNARFGTLSPRDTVDGSVARHLCSLADADNGRNCSIRLLTRLARLDGGHTRATASCIADKSYDRDRSLPLWACCAAPRWFTRHDKSAHRCLPSRATCQTDPRTRFSRVVYLPIVCHIMRFSMRTARLVASHRDGMFSRDYSL